MPVTFTDIHRVDDIVIFGIPDDWTSYPEQVLQGFAWWKMIRILLMQRAVGQVKAVSPPYDVTITIVRSEAEIAEVVGRRHHCDSCQEGFDDAGAALTRGDRKAVAICEFAYDEPGHMTEEGQEVGR